MLTKRGRKTQAKRTTKRLHGKIATDQQLLETSIQKLERTIRDRVAELKRRTDGRLLGARVNLKQAQRIHRDLSRIFREIYGREYRKVVRGFSSINEWITDNFKELDVAARWTSIDRDMVEALRSTALADFRRFGADAQGRIRGALYQHVASMAPFSTLESEISAVLTGRLSKSGRPMTAYASQYAFDATMQYHTTVNLKKAEDAGLTDFEYTGQVLTTTREFCLRRVNRAFSRKKIESWKHKWKGKSGPAMTHRGGYNCGHHWQAIDKDWLDEDELEEFNILGPKPEE